LCFGAPSGGGTRDEFEKRAKEIEKKIDETSGGVLSFEKAEGAEESGEEEKGVKRKSEKRGTRMNFEKAILSYLEEMKDRERLREERRQEEILRRENERRRQEEIQWKMHCEHLHLVKYSP